MQERERENHSTRERKHTEREREKRETGERDRRARGGRWGEMKKEEEFVCA